MGKRIIGIVGAKRKVGMNFSAGLELTSVSQSMVDLVEKFGGIPLIISPSMNVSDVDGVINGLDGLLFSSGEDVSPELYGERIKIEYSPAVVGGGELYHRPIFMKPDHQKDVLEIAFYKAAIQQGMPVLGICRGMQLMNVAEGGTLAQEIESDSQEVRHFLDGDGWIHYHPISIDVSTNLGSILGAENYVISSVHHQSIKRLAESFQVVASSQDGVIEMIERTSSSVPVWGIQGHPEKIYKNFSRYESVFREFCA